MYLASRFHGIRPHEWRRLGWWEQELLAEGLSQEQPQIYRAVSMNKADDPLKNSFLDRQVGEDEEEQRRFIQEKGFQFRQVIQE